MKQFKVVTWEVLSLQLLGEDLDKLDGLDSSPFVLQYCLFDEEFVLIGGRLFSDLGLLNSTGTLRPAVIIDNRVSNLPLNLIESM